MAEEKNKKRQSIEERARELSEPLLNQAGFTLWDVIFEKEGAMNYLRILFDNAREPDKESGITDDDCERMTAPLNLLMDKQDFISHVDILEIGSPGLTRKLRHPEHFERLLGQPLRVLTRNENGKMTAIFGVLSEYDRENNRIILNKQGEEISLEIKKCAGINLDL